eukprot:342323-Prymnesium_polylepis.1
MRRARAVRCRATPPRLAAPRRAVPSASSKLHGTGCAAATAISPARLRRTRDGLTGGVASAAGGGAQGLDQAGEDGGAAVPRRQPRARGRGQPGR